jgi:hypothetical protein
MRKLSLISLFVFCLAQASAYGICTSPQGPYYLFTGSYYVYTQARSCYTGSGSVTNVTSSCPGDDAWSFGSGNSYRQVTFTLTSSEPIVNANKWDIGTWIDFSSPGGTPMDNFEVDIDVQHPDYSVSRYTLLYWSGAYGSLSACGYGPHNRLFSANTGDTVTITVRASNSGTANIVVSVPRLFNEQ